MEIWGDVEGDGETAAVLPYLRCSSGLRSAPSWGRSLRYVLYFGVIREGLHGGGRFLDCARNDSSARAVVFPSC